MNGARQAWIVVVCVLLASVACAHDVDEETAQIAKLMDLRPGMHVADVGAGSGEFSEELARRVGEAGHVYATEVDDGKLNKIRKRIKRSGLFNMSVVEGDSDDANLPAGCCDAILLRYVYHHMSNPGDMCESLRRSLRPGGLLVVVEKDEFGDGIPAEELVAAMIGAGFEVISQHPEWGGHDDSYGTVFRPVH
jgi:ubiquinone/menaquinone biosynthesis C-methylase UbiE